MREREALGLLVGGDVLHVRHGAQPGEQARRPGVQLVGVGVEQRVLELRAADAGADLDVLHRLHEHAHAGHAVHRRLQAGDHGRRRVALGARLERDGEAAGVGRGVDGAGADEGDDAADRRVVQRDLGELGLQAAAMRGIEALCAASVTATITPVSCCGRKPFGHDQVERDGAGQGRRPRPAG